MKTNCDLRPYALRPTMLSAAAIFAARTLLLIARVSLHLGRWTEAKCRRFQRFCIHLSEGIEIGIRAFDRRERQLTTGSKSTSLVVTVMPRENKRRLA